MTKHLTVTEEIAKLLNITKEQAEKVRDEMDMSGLDYSECTQVEFNAAAVEANNYINQLIGG